MIQRQFNLQNEADELAARLRQLIAGQPAHPMSTREVEIAFQNATLRVEDNRVKRVSDGAEGKGLRIAPGDKANSGATVVPILTDGRMVLVVRYRYATGRWSLEFPRGEAVSADTTWAERAEEILSQVGGLDAQATRLLGAVHPDPCILAGSELVILAERCAYRTDHHWDNQQHVAGTLDVPLHCLDQLILRGHIDGGVTLAALCLYRARHEG